jgi:hypothetical protein
MPAEIILQFFFFFGGFCSFFFFGKFRFGMFLFMVFQFLFDMLFDSGSSAGTVAFLSGFCQTSVRILKPSNAPSLASIP